MSLAFSAVPRDDADAEIPILDLTPYLSGQPGAREKLGKQLCHALENIGFYFIKGHGVPQSLIDAVFADTDGSFTVVDWKTGEPPATADALKHAAVQLAVYRLAWAALHGCRPSSVRAAFHYVRSGLTVSPDTLAGADELGALLRRAQAPHQTFCA